MTAHERITTKQKREAFRLLEDMRNDIFKECAEDITAQCLSTVLWTLATAYDFDGDRLNKLVESLKDTKELMDNPSHLHHRFSGIECEKIIKEKYGIDVRKELSVDIREGK